MRIFAAKAMAIGAVWLGAGHVQAQDAAREDSARRSRPSGMKRTFLAFPTGDTATSVVLLERTAPAEVRRGEEFSYELRLTNLTRARISDLTLSEQFPATFTAKSVEPAPSRTATNEAVWTRETFGPGASEVIQVRGSTDRPEDMTWCAAVTFKALGCSSVKVVEPALELVKTAPADVMLCDDIPMRLVVRNTGSGLARNVVVSDALPDGLSAKDGRNSLLFNAGDLASGQSREFTFVARASRIGEYRNTARAVEDGGLSAEASASTVVRLPVLDVAKRGPELRYVGRTATFEILVSNRGDAPARDTVLTDAVPNGTSFVSADNDGRHSGGRVTWSLGTLNPNESRTVSMTVRADTIGRITNTATAQAVCAEGSASASLDIRGIPAILLEVVDIEDPIEVDANVTYEIAVTNQGSSMGTNIVIRCILPEEQLYVSATGPTRGTLGADGRTIDFEPLPTLAPRARSVYRVIATGKQVGDVRFKVQMRSDQIEKLVEETESTNIY